MNPRVLAVIPGSPAGASMIFAKRQVAAVRALGIEIEAHFIESSRVLPWTLARELVHLVNVARTFGPNLVHAHYGTVTASLSAFLPYPLVITFRGGDLNPLPDVGALRNRLGHLLSNLAVLRAKRIVCVSEGLRSKLWWRHEAATVLPSGVDLNLFRPHAKAEARQALGWSATQKVVLFNSRAPKAKRFELAKEAVEIARAEMPTLRLEVMDGTVEPVRVATLMNAADCLLLTSISEGSPTMVLEACASNLPIVSVDISDVRERLQETTRSAIVDAVPKAIARELVDIIRDGKPSNGRGVAERFSLDRIATELVEIYRVALQPG